MSRFYASIWIFLFVFSFSFNVLAKNYSPQYVSVFGWDGDKDAAIAYMDGSFQVRDTRNILVSYKITQNAKSLKWYNHSGYLPCLVTELTQNGLEIKIMNFADLAVVAGERYVVAYSRVQVKNLSGKSQNFILGESPYLTPLTSVQNSIAPGQTISSDFAIPIDRFGKDIPWLSKEAIQGLGSWDQHFSNMKTYWDHKLSEIVQVTTPNEELNNSIKAGYIYTHIIKDGVSLHVGENGYDREFDHDAIGISATLFTLGDLSEAKAILENMTTGNQYPDATWKYSWPWALYLLKTGDAEFVKTHWEKIATTAKQIYVDRTGPGGIMKQTIGIDSTGYWTVDNWSALTGLLAYKYLSEQVGDTDQARWAGLEYLDLLKTINQTLTGTMQRNQIGYIPVSMVEANDANRTKIPNDANWASFLQFGRWAWDGWLMGGEQAGVSLTSIDATYDYGFGRLKEIGFQPYNFSGYPGYSNGYNAGYAASSLRGKQFRTASVEAYEFLLANAQSGPFSWWEGISAPTPTVWEGTHPSGGSGSCPHMWGQAQNTKVVLESIVAEFFDGRLLIGRGIPERWLSGGHFVSAGNFPLQKNKRIDVAIKNLRPNVFELTLKGDVPSGEILFSLPIFLTKKIVSISNETFDPERIFDSNEGILHLPASTRHVIVEVSP
jgi:hypothetical protein